MPLEILIPSYQTKLARPYYDCGVSAGFPSPAEDFAEKKLDLNEYLIKHPAATFFVRVVGDSMINAGIKDGDLLVVDRSLDAKDSSIVIAIINGEFTVKRLRKTNNQIMLLPENPDYPPLIIASDADNSQVWGVVTSVITKLV